MGTTTAWSLSNNDIEGGFLCQVQLPHRLPLELYDHERVQRCLLDLAQAGRLRTEIANLPLVNVKLDRNEIHNEEDNDDSPLIEIELFSEALREAVLSLFCILASGYVHSQTNVSITDDHCKKMGEQTQAVVLPACISIPLKKLSRSVGRLPIWDYAGCVLSNWRLIENTKSVSLENIEILRTITGLECESWFYKVHVVIEAYGGQALLAVRKAKTILEDTIERVEQLRVHVEELSTQASEVNECLRRIAAAIYLMKATFSRLPEKCKDKDFFQVLRPWLSGWPASGVIYEDKANKEAIVGATKEVFGGASGAQSSLLPALDAFFGIRYGRGIGVTKQEELEEDLKKFIEQLQRYRLHMPREHANFLTELENAASIRVFLSLCNQVIGLYYPNKIDPDIEPLPLSLSCLSVDNDSIANGDNPQGENELPMFLKEKERMEVSKLISVLQEVKQSYNLCVESMLQFRRMHVGFATMYITRQAKKAATSLATEEDKEKIEEKAKVGTGGSSFAKHFMTHIDDTRKCLYKNRAPPLPEVDYHIAVDVEADNNNSWQDTQRSYYSYGVFEELKDQVEKISLALDLSSSQSL